jgi:hypothetical protein
MTTTEILERLQDVRGIGPWMARCPVHDDDRPSLSVAEGDDGAILLKCHAES